jgi:hypothetical protein
MYLEKQEMSDDKKINLRLLLENKFNDIRYTKQQQWHLLYLTLIAIAGITSLAISIKPALCFFGVFLVAFDAMIGIMGCGFIIYYAYWLNIYRNQKSSYLQQLHTSSDKKRIKDDVIFTVSFCIVILLSLVASIWSMIQNFS